MRYRVAHRRAAKRSVLTQVLAHMESSMRSSLFLLIVLASGCASSNIRYQSPGVESPAGNSLIVQTYNHEIEKQGLEHYCPSGRCDTLPRLLHGIAPPYPRAEWTSGTSGQATVVFTIGKDGIPTDFKVESSTSPGFSQAAIYALQRWKFMPAKLKGVSVTSHFRQQFPFEVR